MVARGHRGVDQVVLRAELRVGDPHVEPLGDLGHLLADPLRVARHGGGREGDERPAVVVRVRRRRELRDRRDAGHPRDDTLGGPGGHVQAHEGVAVLTRLRTDDLGEGGGGEVARADGVVQCGLLGVGGVVVVVDAEDEVTVVLSRALPNAADAAIGGLDRTCDRGQLGLRQAQLRATDDEHLGAAVPRLDVQDVERAACSPGLGSAGVHGSASRATVHRLGADGKTKYDSNI